MPDYQSIIYGNYKKSDYPNLLAKELHRRFLASLGEDSKLLDLGCGDASMVHAFSSLGLRPEGIDCDRIVKVLQRKDIVIDFGKDPLPYSDNTFDVVFTKSVVEHVSQTLHMLGEAYRVLRPHGLLVVLTPAWEYNYKWFYDDPTHVKPFHRKGLQDALRLAGFSNVNVEYFYHLPLTWKFSVLKFLTGLIRLLPDDWRWFDWQQQRMNIPIRFAKEVQLLAVGQK